MLLFKAGYQNYSKPVLYDIVSQTTLTLRNVYRISLINGICSKSKKTVLCVTKKHCSHAGLSALYNRYTIMEYNAVQL